MSSNTYVRGTPHGPLSARTRFIILLLLSAASVAMTTLALWDEARYPVVIIGALLGTLTILSTIVRNATMYLPWLAISMVLISCLDDKQFDFVIFYQLIGIVIGLGTVASVVPLAKTISSIGKPCLQILPALLMLLPLSWVAACLMGPEAGPIAPAIYSILTLILLLRWWPNRRQKYGSLLIDERKQAAFIVSGIAFQTLIQMNTEREHILMPILLGGTILTLLVATLAAVADVWAPIVGTGPFWMVSLDTSTSLFYVVAPVIVLSYRFQEKYGESVRDLVRDVRSSNAFDELRATDVSVLLMAMSISVGIPMVEALCPFGALLYGDTYTHGQQSTLKMALCVEWRQIQYGIDNFLATIPKGQKLNLIVTQKDVEEDADSLKKFVEAGHYLALTAATSEELQMSYESIESHVGVFPAFFCVARQKWSPSIVSCACQLNLKICLWSHVLDVRTAMSDEQHDNVILDLNDKRGGVIVFLTTDGSASLQQAATTLLEVVGNNTDFSFAALTDVVKKNPPLKLANEGNQG